MIIELIRFKKAADLGAITKASEILFITQPAMTQSIHRLEHELGFKLFKHEGKRVFLTEQGRMVYEISGKIIDLWEKTKSLKDPVNMPPLISIGIFDNAALMLSDYFTQKIKTTKFEIVIDRSESLLKKLRLGLLDLCICILPQDRSLYSSVTLLTTYKEKLLPVSANKDKKDISEIQFIMYNKDSQTYKYVDEAFVQAGIKPKIVVESVNPIFKKELALKGIGTALLPMNMVENELKSKKLFIQKLPITFERTCGIFMTKETDNPLLQEIIREMQLELNAA